MHGSGDLAIVIRREGINAFGKPIFPRVIRGGHNCIRTVPQRALEIPEERGLFCLPLAVVEEPLCEERERERERERGEHTGEEQRERNARRNEETARAAEL